MPELPEVETVRLSLAHLVGRRIESIQVLGKHAVRPQEFARLLRERTFVSSERRGKYLAFRLDSDDVLLCHLRMTGRLIYLPPRARSRWPARHTHVVMRLEGGGRVIFNDTRKFGRLWVVPDADLEAQFPEGPDALRVAADDLDWPGRTAPVKSLLMDQRLLAGLGNIYADESLFRAGIDPRRPAGALTAEEREKLAAGIRGVLADALAHGGTTFLDYRDGSGRPGGFRHLLNVYGRAGEACRVCGTGLRAARLGGRRATWCPSCQV